MSSTAHDDVIIGELAATSRIVHAVDNVLARVASAWSDSRTRQSVARLREEFDGLDAARRVRAVGLAVTAMVITHAAAVVGFGPCPGVWTIAAWSAAAACGVALLRRTG